MLLILRLLACDDNFAKLANASEGKQSNRIDSSMPLNIVARSQTPLQSSMGFISANSIWKV
jgi:hypothetical protein